MMTVGNLFYMYLNQFEYGDYSIAPIYFSGTNGPVSWINSTYSLSDMWYIFAEFLILILIIFLVSIFLLFNNCISNSLHFFYALFFQMFMFLCLHITSAWI